MAEGKLQVLNPDTVLSVTMLPDIEEKSNG